ncbi:resistance to inhibitors of cholinesterase protein 3-like [Elysia marginata]|uniref:Resistance to inhibitors of cholinesterase protein 3-like n=1 Tax=Elysia marginata TaxID=1093978 RepID=A0AAV4JTM2_9GAST|nr:resistance to inhibitors of cholinesterase protein 3-like [Elysia marginata]
MPNIRGVSVNQAQHCNEQRFGQQRLGFEPAEIRETYLKKKGKKENAAPVVYTRSIAPAISMFSTFPVPFNPSNDVNPPGINNPNHPHLQKKGADDIRRHMRAGPHPGMRAAAEMQKQQAQQGSGRGMMGVVLPMYAIGIVLYLVYTLFKVFNKSKGNNDSNVMYKDYREQRAHYGRRNNRYDRMGFPTNYEGNDDVHGFLNDEQRRHELEELLTRVDDKNVSTEEMRLLQRRLEETEAQMSRILQAMQSVQTNVDRMNIPQEETEEYGPDEPVHAEGEENQSADDTEVDHEAASDGKSGKTENVASSSSTEGASALQSSVPEDNNEDQDKDQVPSNGQQDDDSEDNPVPDESGAAQDSITDNDNKTEEICETREDKDMDTDNSDQETVVRLRRAKPENEQ